MHRWPIVSLFTRQAAALHVMLFLFSYLWLTETKKRKFALYYLRFAEGPRDTTEILLRKTLVVHGAVGAYFLVNC